MRGQVGEAIDKMFANSPDETQTQTEKEYAQAYFKQFGDVNLIVTRHRRRGVLHAAVPHRQHHDAVRAGAHSRSWRC